MKDKTFKTDNEVVIPPHETWQMLFDLADKYGCDLRGTIQYETLFPMCQEWAVGTGKEARVTNCIVCECSLSKDNCGTLLLFPTGGMDQPLADIALVCNRCAPKERGGVE